MKNVLLIHTGFFILYSYKKKKGHGLISVAGITLTGAALNLKVRKTYTPHTTITPKNGSDKLMDWTLSAPDMATPHQLMPPLRTSFPGLRQRCKSMLSAPPKAPRYGAAAAAKMKAFYISRG